MAFLVFFLTGCGPDDGNVPPDGGMNVLTGAGNECLLAGADDVGGELPKTSGKAVAGGGGDGDGNVGSDASPRKLNKDCVA